MKWTHSIVKTKAGKGTTWVDDHRVRGGTISRSGIRLAYQWTGQHVLTDPSVRMKFGYHIIMAEGRK